MGVESGVMIQAAFPSAAQEWTPCLARSRTRGVVRLALIGRHRQLKQAFAVHKARNKGSSCLPENSIDGRADGMPARLFDAQSLFACGGQLVDASTGTGIFLDPLGANQTRFLHPIERGVERPHTCTQHLAGGAGNGSHDGGPVKPWAPRQYLQHEQIHRTLQSIGLSHIDVLYRSPCRVMTRSTHANRTMPRFLWAFHATERFRSMLRTLFASVGLTGFAATREQVHSSL